MFLPAKDKKWYFLNGWMDEKWEKSDMLMVMSLWGINTSMHSKNAALYEKREGCEIRDNQHLSKK